MADFGVPGNTPRLNVISLGVFILSIALAVSPVCSTQGPVAADRHHARRHSC